MLCFPGRFFGFPGRMGSPCDRQCDGCRCLCPPKSCTHFSSDLMVVQRFPRGKQNKEKKATGLIPLPNIVQEKSKNSGCFLSQTKDCFPIAFPIVFILRLHLGRGIRRQKQQCCCFEQNENAERAFLWAQPSWRRAMSRGCA